MTDSEAKCPQCGELVKCNMVEYVRAGTVHKMRLYHAECETEWSIDLNTMKVTVLYGHRTVIWPEAEAK